MTKAQLSSLRLHTNILVGLLTLFIASQSVQAQWATNGNNINNTNTGNVGIGTTAPTAQLHVAGASGAMNNTGATAPDALQATGGVGGNGSWSGGAGGIGGAVNFTGGTGGTPVAGSGSALGGKGGSINLTGGSGGPNIFGVGGGAGGDILLNGGAGVSNTAGNVIFANIRGNVGIGVTGPTYKLQVSGSGGSVGDSVLVTDSNTITTAVDIANTSSGAKKWRLQSVGSGVSGRVGNFELVQIESDLKVLVVQPGGNVGVGTISPSATFHVQGTGRFTGNLTVDGNLAAKYQDVAEWVPAARELPPGTVVTLNRSQSNFVEPSSKPYDTRVAGVISEKPGIALGERGENKVLVATTGRVRIKVDATNAPIEIGDLLVTSEKEGVAMKSMPIDVGGVDIHRPGTLIGKALEPLAKGQGEILVLLSLQ